MTLRSGPLGKVLGGYYKGSGADIRPDASAHGIKFRGHTTYVSLAQGANGFPRTSWIDELSRSGALVNYVLELKVYGATPPATVPAPNGLMAAQGTAKFWSWVQLLCGDLDPLLDQVADKIKTLPYRINIQVTSERDTDHQSGGTIDGKSYTWTQLDSLSVAGVQYIIRHFKERGVANATFTAGIGGFNQAAFMRCYVPGVDAIQYNCYNHGSTWQEPSAVFGRTYAWLDLLPDDSKALPVYVAEYGSQVSTDAHSQADWIRAVPAALEAYPRIAYAAYFNSGWGKISDPASLDAMAEAYNSDPFLV